MLDAVVIGGGIGGLSLALALGQIGIKCQIFEAVQELKALGVGLNLLPHAMKELDTLGVGDEVSRRGVETRELCFYTSNGQLVDREPRGRFDGFDWPQISI